jgi:hypothetical protein
MWASPGRCVKHSFLVKDVNEIPLVTDQEGVLHRQHRPARSGAGRHPEGHDHAERECPYIYPQNR